MIVVKHPTLPVDRLVGDADLDSWLASGWLPLLDDDQMERYRELEHEVELEAMTIPKLRAHAAEQGIDLAGATRKADILAAIKASHVSTAASAAERPADTQEGEAQ